MVTAAMKLKDAYSLEGPSQEHLGLGTGAMYWMLVLGAGAKNWVLVLSTDAEC